MPTTFPRTFCRDEDGAVTVDWVVLTAAIVGLGIAVVVTTRSGTMAMGNSIAESLEGTAAGTLTYDANTGTASPVRSSGTGGTSG